jgi:hypothetical protein
MASAAMVPYDDDPLPGNLSGWAVGFIVLVVIVAAGMATWFAVHH